MKKASRENNDVLSNSNCHTVRLERINMIRQAAEGCVIKIRNDNNDKMQEEKGKKRVGRGKNVVHHKDDGGGKKN